MTEKNKGKKLLTWTLALSMTLALPPVGVFAEEGAGGEGSQQTNSVPATEQPDGSSNGSGTANNEGNKLASTSEEGGQTNDPAPPQGHLVLLLLARVKVEAKSKVKRRARLSRKLRNLKPD